MAFFKPETRMQDVSRWLFEVVQNWDHVVTIRFVHKSKYIVAILNKMIRRCWKSFLESELIYEINKNLNMNVRPHVRRSDGTSFQLILYTFTFYICRFIVFEYSVFNSIKIISEWIHKNKECIETIFLLFQFGLGFLVKIITRISTSKVNRNKGKLRIFSFLGCL